MTIHKLHKQPFNQAFCTYTKRHFSGQLLFNAPRKKLGNKRYYWYSLHRSVNPINSFWFGTVSEEKLWAA